MVTKKKSYSIDEVIGMPVIEARGYLMMLGKTMHVRILDGQPLYGALEYNPDIVEVEVENMVVTDILDDDTRLDTAGTV